MASVSLQFVPPSNPNLKSLKIWEGTSAIGPFSVIEQVTAIGISPEYIDRYTSENASDPVNNWFAISWVDLQGAESDISQSVKGGTQLLVGRIVDRALLRDPLIDEKIVAQEAEAVIEMVYPGQIPPLASEVSANDLSALTLLSIGRVYLFDYLMKSSVGVDSFTAGLVSIKSGTGGSLQTSLAAIEALINRANGMLGLNVSLITQMEEIAVSSGFRKLVGADLSRGIIEIS